MARSGGIATSTPARRRVSGTGHPLGLTSSSRSNACSPGTWLADLCAAEGLPVVLGQARSRQAIHGGHAQHAPSDAPQIAVLRRGGLRPQAAVDPAAMRATRDLLRRRRPLMRTRAERRTHLHQTPRPENLPEMGQKLAANAHRAGGAARCAEPAGHKSLAGDLAWLGHDDARRRDLEVSVRTTAQAHHPTTRDVLRTVPGLGEILRLVLRSALQASHRCPRGQDGVSSGRLVPCAQAAAGTRYGTGGTKSGTAARTWACSDAAVLFGRDHPAGQPYRTRVETPPGTGTAWTGLAHPWARAVSALLTRATACTLARCIPGSRRGASAPDASPDREGVSRHSARGTRGRTASVNAQAHVGLRP
jgi:hypothetical protein